MESVCELIVTIDRAKMDQARQMSDGERILAGARMFNRVCRWAREGIRNQFRDADEATVDRELERRLALSRRLERRS
jgi:hypothetical protein